MLDGKVYDNKSGGGLTGSFVNLPICPKRHRWGTFWVPFWVRFWYLLGPISGPVLGLRIAPLRWAILSENPRESKGFGAFGPPQKAWFGVHFWYHLGSVFVVLHGSILGSVSGLFGNLFWIPSGKVYDK